MDIWQEIDELFDYISSNQNVFRIIGAFLIIVTALALRRLFVKVVSVLLARFTKKTKTQIDDHLVDVIHPPLCFTFITIGVLFAVALLDLPQRYDDFINDKIISSMFAFAVFWAAYRAAGIASEYIESFAEKTNTRIDDMLMPLLKNSIKTLVAVIGVIVIVDRWGYNVAGLLAGLGLGGLAFALAARDTASNLFGGITIMLDRPFSIGDWVKTPHVEGTVEEMGIRSTRVRTFAQALVTVPNSMLINEPITNWSRMGKRRITYRLGLTYGTPPDKLRECITKIREMLMAHPGIHKKTIFVYFEKFGESSLDIFMYFFTNTTVWQEFLEVQEDVNIKVMEIVDEMGLSVAFPSTSIYLERNEAEPDTE